MNNKFRNIFVAALLSAIILPMFAGKPNDADRRKAEYAFIEAISKKEAGDYDAAYALLKHAHAFDPENPTINFYLGFTALNLEYPTQEELDSAIALMRHNTVDRPADYYENYVYAALCSSLGRNDESVRVLEQLVAEYPSKTELFPKLAIGYGAQGNFEKAIATIDSVEKTEGRTLNSTVMKVNYLFQLKDTVGIISNAKMLLAEAPNSAEPNALAGNIFAQLDKPDSAFHYYNRALEIDPDYGYANLQKANLYNSLGDSTNYEKEITNVLLNKNIEVDTKIDILTDYIRNCIQQGDSSARVDNMFRVILNQHPHEAPLRNLFCDYLAFKKDYKNAAEQLSYTLDIDPSNPQNWERLMWFYAFLKEPQKAIETGKKAIEYAPDELTLRRTLAWAYSQNKDYDLAIATYDSLLISNKEQQTISEAEIYTSMGDVYQQMGDSANTVKNYEMALAIDPGNVMALNNYAYYLLIHDPSRLNDAAKMAETAVSAEPDNSSYLDTFAWALFLKRDYQKALTFIEKAAEKREPTDNNSELWEHYGDILFMLGKPDEALAKWKDALKGNPDSKLLKKKIENKAYFYE